MKKTFVFILTMALIISSGCSFQPDYSIAQTENPPPTKTPTSATPTIIPPSATFRLTPTPSSPSPTLTSLPKLSPDESVKLLFELLKNNGRCLLPCILGLQPGISSSEMKSFFNQFPFVNSDEISIDKVSSVSRKLNAVGFFIRYDNIYINIGISSYEEENQMERLTLDSSVYKGDPNQRLVNRLQWEPLYAEVMHYYLLPQILTIYGKPSKTLILTYRNDRQRPDVTSFPFYLVILYPEKGFFIEYEMNRETNGDKFSGCPSKAFVNIAVWDPENQKAFGKITQDTRLGVYPDEYKPINEATSITDDEFYRIFTNSENKDCIQTPIEVWPNP